MNKFISKIFATCFLVTVAGAFLLTVPFFEEQESDVVKTENRTVTRYVPLKSFRNSEIKAYFKNLDAFIGDRLLLRGQIVSFMNGILGDPELFTSFESLKGKGVIGEDGFLFLGNSYSKVLDRHFSKNFDEKPSNFKKLSARLKQFKQQTENAGAKFSVLIAPDKHGIYCEKFPVFMMQKPCSLADEFTAKLVQGLEKENFDVFYPYAVLRKHADIPLYYKTDSHWNLRGAGLAFDAFVDHLKGSGRLPAAFIKVRPEYAQSKVTEAMDLGAVVGVNADFKVDDVDYVLKNHIQVLWSQKGSPFIDTEIMQAYAQGQNRDWYGEMSNSQALNKIRLLVICDSFTTALSRIINLNFSQVFYISRHSDDDFCYEKIVEFRPDLVIYECVERDFL